MKLSSSRHQKRRRSAIWFLLPRYISPFLFFSSHPSLSQHTTLRPRLFKICRAIRVLQFVGLPKSLCRRQRLARLLWTTITLSLLRYVLTLTTPTHVDPNAQILLSESFFPLCSTTYGQYHRRFSPSRIELNSSHHLTRLHRFIASISTDMYCTTLFEVLQGHFQRHTVFRSLNSTGSLHVIRYWNC
ncbi:hypothetical protein I3842_05G173700 [Carya illinoinensis]|uniref:Uncharacterized protein n=1 Tax=Carya illinoinensis TaxID=32201 RepID=A0A922F0J3_CARIL|nr:hypothetical protein I3842_05G173700 [Carya illinoinensis]